MAVAAVAALLDVISVNRNAARPAAQQPDKLLLVLIAGAVGGTVGQKAAEDLWVGRVTSTQGCGSDSPCEIARRAPASRFGR